MKKKFKPEELNVLRKLSGVAMETAVEILEKRGFFAFINNAFTMVSIGGELPELGEEVKYIRNNPDVLDKLEKEEASKYPKYADHIIIKTYRKIYSAIVYNVSVGLSIADDWKEYNKQPVD
jgi:hypothetical protein